MIERANPSYVKLRFQSVSQSQHETWYVCTSVKVSVPISTENEVVKPNPRMEEIVTVSVIVGKIRLEDTIREENKN